MVVYKLWLVYCEFAVEKELHEKGYPAWKLSYYWMV